MTFLFWGICCHTLSWNNIPFSLRYRIFFIRVFYLLNNPQERLQVWSLDTNLLLTLVEFCSKVGIRMTYTIPQAANPLAALFFAIEGTTSNSCFRSRGKIMFFYKRNIHIVFFQIEQYMFSIMIH